MSETNIPQGQLEFKNIVHGAQNYLLTWFDDPENWEFKQFVSQEQLDEFAAENNLIVKVQNGN